MSEVNGFMQANELFAGFSKLEKQAVMESLKSITVKQDQLLFRQGDPGTTLYIVKRGIIGGYISLHDNKQMEVGRFTPGQSFGEMAIIEAIPRTMTCYAVTDADLFMMEALEFYRFVWEHPMIGVKLLKTMTRHMVSWLYETDNFLNSLVRWGENARLRAITDGLTGLFNKHYLEETVAFAMAKYKQSRTNFCYLMLDVDNFHAVNTAWGTVGGDELLKAIAGLMKTAFGENAVVAKLGGDEFAAVLHDCTIPGALEQTRQFLQYLRDSREELLVGDRPLNIPISMSIGVAEYPTHGANRAELQSAADHALYLAKEAGRDTVMVTAYKGKKGALH